MEDKITVPDATYPATDIIPVTPHDTNPIVKCRALYIGTGGTIKVKTPGSSIEGTTRTVTVPAGILPLHVLHVYATGTTAENISALY